MGRKQIVVLEIDVPDEDTAVDHWSWNDVINGDNSDATYTPVKVLGYTNYFTEEIVWVDGKK